MGKCKCATINLAQVSLQSLKAQEHKLQRLPARIDSSLRCRPAYPIPPPPRLIKYKTIQICQAHPIDFIHPAVPCICPPCPICPSRIERLMSLLKLIGKAYVVYFVYELANAGEYWGNADAASNLVTSVSNMFLQMFGIKELYTGYKLGFLQVDMLKYNILTYWDKFIYTTFWYTVGIPTKYFNEFSNDLNKALFCKTPVEELREQKEKEEAGKKEQGKKKGPERRIRKSME